jgi:Carboxypeptidase regulatory-like domain
VLALLGMLVAGTVRAQGIGSLTGTVVDASTQKPVADVVVTATSPNLQGEQVAVTDSSGSYRISQLPPGSYSLRFEKEAYRPYSRAGIALDADRTLRLNVDLLPEAVTLTAPEVVVVGKAPVIDVGTTQTGLTVTSTFSQNVPISPAAAGNGGIRSFSGLALAAPQVAGDLFGISIAGTTSPENSYLIDGLSFSDTGFGVNNKNGFTGGGGTAGSDFSVEFVDQMNVITGGYMPEYGRTTGGVLSVTTKSGGNEFHGSVFATWTPGFMAQTGQTVGTQNSVIGEATKLYNAGDIGFTLGGYIIKDKLWFFVGFNPSQFKTEAIRTVTPFDTDGNPIPGAQPIASATRNYFQTQTNYSYIGKLTYLINSDNRISLSVAGSPDSFVVPFSLPLSGGNGTLAASSYAGNDNTLDMVLRLNSSFLEKKLLLDITVGWHHQNNNVTAYDGTSFGQSGDAIIPNVVVNNSYNIESFIQDPTHNDPNVLAACGTDPNSLQCSVGGYLMGGPAQLLRNVTEDRIQAKAIVTYFLNALGHQTLKAGVDVEYISYENKIGYAGEDGYIGLSNPNSANGAYLDFRTIGYLQAPDNPVFLPFQDQKPTALLPGAFIQDSWNIFDKVTLNVGVRFDAEYMYDQNGQLALALNNQWAPRIGLIWDPTYQGKSKIYASYAFYYEAVPLDLADRSLIGNEFISALHFPCANPGLTGQRCNNTTSISGAFGVSAGPNQYWTTIGADKELIDPNIGPQKTDEFQVGAEYEIFPNARLGVNYTHRGLSRLIEDFSNNSASSYVLGNPGQGIATNFPNPARIYNGYTVSLTKTFADHWQAQASYTYITLNGNVDGLFTPGQGQLDPNINATYDLPQFLINGFGPLAADTQSRVKFYGSYQFLFTANVGLTIGAAYNGHSGAPISALGGDTLYGGDVVFIIPRGIYGRLPWVHDVDLHATVDIGLGQDMRLQLGADCFNVLGSQQVIAVDQSWVFPANTPVKAIPNGTIADLQHITSPNGTPIPSSAFNPNFGHATAYQAPRNFRLLARFTF